MRNIGGMREEDVMGNFRPNDEDDGHLRMLKRYMATRNAAIVRLRAADTEGGGAGTQTQSNNIIHLGNLI